MTWPPTRQRLAAASLCIAALCASPLVHAQPTQQMVSVSGATLNMRSGPGTNAPVLWELKMGYPLQIMQRQGNWLQVRDFEGDTGWVARSLTGTAPHHVVKAREANIRSGPGTQHAVVGKAEHGELLRTREKRADWVRVERTDGPGGWIAKSLLWGW
ncbi:MAG: SH3 domain-containing protein [Hydrogenophaga sp.]|uniref:SH3 domain-containing protein n=1 Tax=Hydrogenophaga sp. TaxID=1904254 RepID=UPI0027256DE9|nr:SH3 domain-containing protein [Hydrogenophaga sp.]MDO9148429.1 SH3 domain-containing protein [Hydrogenophaga sp.]MDO9605158.1 SH3 domain-containing protein [Hydrogenophaga sp.]MDP2165438.1 SH3 domain-containing protein [Hydrogenophaga sp.]MDP3475430.1 SH3 domain-containing protein [Hydrogenophaga sp.]